MELKEFIRSHNVDMARERVDSYTLLEMADAISCRFGTELEAYILNYGYLGYQYVEFCGINARQLEKSDMIKLSCVLHARSPQTCGYIVLESVGDGFYVLVNEEDMVFDFDEGSGEMVATGKALNDYILDRFQAVDK